LIFIFADFLVHFYFCYDIAVRWLRTGVNNITIM